MDRWSSSWGKRILEQIEWPLRFREKWTCTQQERGNHCPITMKQFFYSWFNFFKVIRQLYFLSRLIKSLCLLRQFLHGNWDANSVRYNSLQTPFRARFVRIVPTHWYNQICLRVELYGCKQTWGKENQRHNFSNLVWFYSILTHGYSRKDELTYVPQGELINLMYISCFFKFKGTCKGLWTVLSLESTARRFVHTNEFKILPHRPTKLG